MHTKTLRRYLDLFVCLGVCLWAGTVEGQNKDNVQSGRQIQSELDLLKATYQRVEAAREVWQNKGELSKVTSDVLLESATTYLDLLAARRGESVARELIATTPRGGSARSRSLP